jgi:hypothetical protein
MASGHKTGGRQKGTPNKRKAQLDAKFAETAGQVTAGLSASAVASITPIDVMLLAMRLEVKCGQLRSAAKIAEKAAPYIHAKMAPRSEDGDADRDITIRVTGGLPD